MSTSVRARIILNPGKWVLWTLLLALQAGCSMEAKLGSLLGEENFAILSDSGPINSSNASAYHVRGRCPVGTDIVQFPNSNTLACNAGIFDGHLDLSSLPEGSQNLQLYTSAGDKSNWDIVKDTTPPGILLGNPITSYTGLHKNLQIPVTFADAKTITLTSSHVVISGSGTNNCSVIVSGSGLTTRTLTLLNCDQAAGSIALAIQAGVAQDENGNASPASNSSNSITVDNVAPTLAAVQTGPSTGNQSTSFTWDLNFTGADLISLNASEVVLSGASAGCVPSLSGTGLTQRQLTISGCSGTGSLAIAIPASAALDLAMNPSAALSLGSVTLDNQGPPLSLGNPSPASGHSGTTFSWEVTYSGATAITLASSDVQLIGTSAGCSTSISGSGLTTRFVQVSGCTGNGTLQVQVNAGSASDSAGNQAPASAISNSVTLSNAGVGIALSNPTLSSINSSSSTQFTITYINATSYTLAVGDISLIGATAGCSKTLSGSGPTFNVQISGCSGNGSLQISVASGTANDGAGNFAPAAGPSATVTVDNIAPTIAVSGPTPTLGGSGTSFSWVLNFTDAQIVNLVAGDVTMTGATSGCSLNVTGSGLASRTVTVTNCTGNGPLNLAVPANVITDGAGNGSIANASLGAVTVDNTSPTLSIGAPSPSNGNSATTFSWVVTYTNADTVTLSSSDISLTTALTGCLASVSGSGTTTRTVSVTGCSGNGTLKFSIAANSASDLAGNQAPASALSTQVVVDNTAPTIAFGSPSPSSGNSTSQFAWVLTFNGADTVNLNSGHVQFVGTTAGCSASITGTGVVNRTVTVTGCTGNGTLGIAIDTGAISDLAGNSNSLTSGSPTVNVSNLTPDFTVSGLPFGHTDINNFSTNSTGPDIISYVYKIGPSSTVNCADSTGYSVAQSPGALAHDISAIGNVEVTACFKGQDSFTTWSAIVEQRWSRLTTSGGVATGTNICGSPPQLNNNLSSSSASGILTDSGGMSGQYLDFETCIYTITTGAPITLKIDEFNAENSYDFLKIYDGTTAGTQLANLTGMQGNPNTTYTANSGTMTLKWTTDSSVTRNGFVVTWGGASPVADDPTPDDFIITNQVNGTINTVYSRTFVVNGIAGNVYAGVSGYDAQIRNDTTGSTWGNWITLSNGDSISIRMTSGGSTAENRLATVQVGTLTKSWNIYWDNTAPIGSISIAGGAANSTTVATTLDLTVSDGSPGAIQMYITQTAGCSADGTWAPFSTPANWTLANQSMNNTVYVKFGDEAGNESPCYSDSIDQDNLTAPIPTLTSTSPTNTNAATVPLAIEFDEPVTGLQLSDFTMTNAAISGLTGSGKSYTATVTPAGSGTFSALLPANAVQDLQSNNSVASNTRSWFFDDIGPGVTLSTASTAVKGPFDVILRTNDNTITNIPNSSLSVTNGTYGTPVKTTDGVTTWFKFRVTPTSEGAVTVVVPANTFFDSVGNGNSISNALSVNYFVPPVVNFVSSNSILTEGNSNHFESITLSLSPAKNYTVTVKVVRSSFFSTAVNATHYNLNPIETVTFAANSTTATLPIEIIGNASVDGNHILQLSLTADAAGIEFGLTDTHTLIIKDDETTVVAPLAQKADGQSIFTIDANHKLFGLGTGQSINSTLGVNYTNTKMPIDAANSYDFLAVGDEMGCAITTGGVLKCWGWWPNGPSSAGGDFLTVRDSGTLYKSVDVTRYYNAPICGITTANKLRCRGSNTVGQLLTGNFDFQDNFVTVDGSTDYSQVAVSRAAICAITSAGALNCWGENGYGQVGNGTTGTVATPTLIDAGTTYSKIFGGDSRFCGITSTNELKCWGLNSTLYILGTGDTFNKTTPTVIDPGVQYKDLVNRNYRMSCGLTISGQLKCWGDLSGETGNHTYDNISSYVSTPTLVQPGKTYQSITGMNNNICLLDSDSNTLCAIPLQQNFLESPLKDVQFANDWSKLAPSFDLACGITTAGVVKCAAVNSYVAIGDSYKLQRTQYIPVFSSQSFVDIATYSNMACAVDTTGKLYCWGENNSYNPFDLSGATPITVPQLIAYAPPNLEKVYVRGNTLCVIDNTGTAYCKGKNYSGNLGVGTTTPWINQFISPFTSSKFIKLSIDDYLICGITTTNALECWGNKPGDGTTGTLNPIVVEPGTSFIDVSVNGLQRCAITSTGVLKCWGTDDSSLGLGNPSYSDILVPTVVDSGVNYTKVLTAASQSSTCGITSANELKCWGWGYFNTNTPTVRESGTQFTDVVGVASTICAKTTAGAWKCNGSNFSAMATGRSTSGYTPLTATH